MQTMKIILNFITEFVAKLEPAEIIVPVILCMIILIFIVGFLKGELTQWTLKCYNFLKENKTFILIFIILIYIIIQQYELADLIIKSHHLKKREIYEISKALEALTNMIKKK